MTPNIAMTTFEHVMEGRKNITKYQAAEVPKMYLQVSRKNQKRRSGEGPTWMLLNTGFGTKDSTWT